MNAAARIQAALELLEQIASTPRPADALTSAYFRSRRYIGSKDRAAISTLLYTILRHATRLNWWIAEKKGTATPRLAMITYLRLAENKTDDALTGTFNGEKFAPAALTEDEKKFLKRLEGHDKLDHPRMPDEVTLECPAWAAPSLLERFGKDFVKEMQATLTPAPLDLRVNALKGQRDPILKQIQSLGFNAVACELSPYGIRISERPSLAELPMLKNGQVEIQDEGSQLVAVLVDAKPGERVVDFCAGAGGKTLAIAAQMQNKGRIMACDILANRLKRSTERFRKAGVHNIEVRPLTSERDPWVKRHKESFDRVLVDAPCSGTGTWRRNPDARSRQLGPGLTALLPLQASILDSASRLVKKGGRLVYATCSMLPEENEKQVEAFLATHTDFELVDCAPMFDKKSKIKGPMLSLTPLQHNTDGFFGAVMQRKGKPEKSAANEAAAEQDAGANDEAVTKKDKPVKKSKAKK